MAKVLTDVDTYTASVTVPEDGDTRNAASVETAFQALANRTKNTKGRVDTLAAAVTSTVCDYVHNSAAAVSGQWSSDGATWSSAADSGYIEVSLNRFLVNGADLTSVSVRVNPGAPRTGTDRMSFTLYRGPAAGGADDTLSVAHYDDATTDAQTVVVVPSASHTINTETHVYRLGVVAGNTGLASADTLFGGMVVICAVPALA